MMKALVLPIATVMVLMVHSVRGTAHLSFANNTEVNITRTGCGMTKLCVETPSGCDPAGNSQCLFTSLNASTPMAPNGTDLSVELSGFSTGYIALGLTANSSEGTTLLFICAQNNGSFFFRTMTRNNSDDTISPSETRTTEIRGSIKNDQIQCEFDIPGTNASDTRSSHAVTFQVLLGNGTVNGTMIGPFMESFRSSPLNLRDPTSNTTTTMTPTPTPTSPSMTTSGSNSAALSHALLLLMSVVSLFVLKMA